MNLSYDSSKLFITTHKIPKFIDIDILQKYVTNDIDANKEFYEDMKSTYKISNPIKAEWMLNKSIKNGKMIGGGSSCCDINVDNEYLIDVSVLTLNGNYSNEKSILQNFTGCNNLDSLFIDNKGSDAVKIFKDNLHNKYKLCNEIRKIFYVIFICHKKMYI